MTGACNKLMDLIGVVMVPDVRNVLQVGGSQTARDRVSQVIMASTACNGLFTAKMQSMIQLQEEC